MSDLILPPEQRYDCHSCTKCCRGNWLIHVPDAQYDRIAQSPLFERLKAETGQDPVYKEEIFEPGKLHGRTAMHCGQCVFLDSDRLCSVHKELGSATKPLSCRQFPFILRDTPDGVVVGLSFFCTAVTANSGRPLVEHSADIEGILREHRPPSVGHSPVPFVMDYTLSWPSYRLLEATVADWVRGPSLRDGLWRVWTSVGFVIVRLFNMELADGVVPEDVFAALWQQASVTAIGRDEVFETLERIFLNGILGALDSADPQICSANTDALTLRGSIVSDNLGQEVDLTHFDDFRGRFDAGWSEPLLRRFIEHLVFRKFLGYKRNVVANAAALFMVLPLLEWFRDLSAFAAGKLQPEPDDLHRALDICERSFTLHSEAMDPFLHQMGKSYAQQLFHLPQVMASGS